MKELWKHQAKAVEKAMKLGSLGLFMEQGTGKTRTIIEILKRQIARDNSLGLTLIVCPKIVCHQWASEIAAYSTIHKRQVCVLDGSGKERYLKFNTRVSEGCRIFIMNYQSLLMPDLVKALTNTRWTNLVCDESHRLKNPSSKMAKVAYFISKLCRNKFILTGTPILDGHGMDLFMQMKILDDGKSFGTNFFAFRGHYFMDKNAGMPAGKHFPNWVLRASSLEEFRAKLDAASVRVLKKDCLDLPPLIRKEVYCELTPEQQKHYKALSTEFITWADSKHEEPPAVVAQLAITKTLRLQQLVSGFLKDENGMIHRVKSNRIDTLVDIIEDIPDTDKIIIWACHQENYTMIKEAMTKLGRKYVELTGTVKGSDYDVKQKDVYTHVVNEFRTNPDVTVMIANQAAGGVGVNLIEAKHAIYYSKPFSLEHDLQSEARNYRGGSEMHSHVNRIDIVSPNTIDELINKKLLAKDLGAKLIADIRDNLTGA